MIVGKFLILCEIQVFQKKLIFWGTWVAQSVKLPTLDFGSDHDLTVRRIEPSMGSALIARSLLGILSLCPFPALSLKINKHLKN